MKVAVLYGGNSSEREISLKTGIAVIKGLSDAGFDVCPFEINEPDIIKYANEIAQSDIAFIGYHGGFGENGHVQAVLEMLQIPFTGSMSFESAIAMRKHLSIERFRKHNIPTPDSIVVYKGSGFDESEVAKLGLPLAVKPAQEGSTIGFTKVTDITNLKKAVDYALKFDSVVLIEEFISGQELTVAIIGDKIAPPLLISPKDGFYDFEHKYTKGKTEYICPAPIEPELAILMQKYAKQAFDILGCRNYGRVDFRLREDGKIFCLEVNTLPGMTDLSLVPMSAKEIGLSFPQLLRLLFSHHRCLPWKRILSLILHFF